MSLAKKVTEGVSWLAVAQVAQRASALVITAILARQLSPEDFGLIALTLLVINFIAYFQDMGLSAALVQRTALSDEHLATAFWVNCGAGAALALIGVALSFPIAAAFKEARLVPLLLAMLITLPLNGLGWVSNALLQRKLEFRQIALIEWGSSLISGSVGIGLAFAGAGVWSLVAQNIAASIAITSGRLFAAHWMPAFKFSVERARELFSFSLSAFGYTVVNHGMRNIDNALIGGVLGATMLGYYSLAYNLILLPGMTICGLIGRVMFPALSSVQDDLVRFRRAYLRMIRTVSVITLPLIIGLGATAPLFVRVIYGEKWLPVVPILQVLIVIGVFEAIATSGLVFWALGRPNLILAIAVFSLILMTGGFLFGLHWGVMGIAWAYVAISPFIFVIPHLLANRLMKLKLWSFLRALAPPFCAAIVMGLFVQLLIRVEFRPLAWPWANLVSLILIGAIIYAVLLTGIGAVHFKREGIISWLSGRHLSEIDKQPQASH